MTCKGEATIVILLLCMMVQLWGAVAVLDDIRDTMKEMRNAALVEEVAGMVDVNGTTVNPCPSDGVPDFLRRGRSRTVGTGDVDAGPVRGDSLNETTTTIWRQL